MRSLFSLVYDWRQQYKASDKTKAVLDPQASSCAQLSVEVYCGGAIDGCVRQLAELLHLVELMTRPGVDPRALHYLIRYRDDCPVDQGHCSYCDDVDQLVTLKLTPIECFETKLKTRSSLEAIVRRALFEWNEDDKSKTSPEFRQLRKWLLDHQVSRATRSRPVGLNVEIADAGFEFGVSCCHEEEVKLLVDHVRATDDGRFRITTFKVFTPTLRIMQLLATMDVPIDLCYPSKFLRQASEEIEKLLPLRITNLSADGDDNAEVFFRFLRAHASQLKTLCVDYHKNGKCEREAQMKLIGRSLLAVDVPVRLERLELNADMDEEDMQTVIAQIESIAPQGSGALTSGVRFRTFCLMDSKISQVKGKTLGKLLTLSGGVESLELPNMLNGAFPIAEIPDLVRSCPSMRSLEADVSCDGWKSMPQDAVMASEVSIQTLTLRFSGTKPTVLASAVERLLRIVGESLTSLRIVTEQRRIAVRHSVAAIIAQKCPNLEELELRNANEAFISTLLKEYAHRPCNLKRLSFVASGNDYDFRGLVCSLSQKIHPLARVLRWLHIDASSQDPNDVCWLGNDLKGVLEKNQNMRVIQLGAPKMWLRDDGETFRAGGFSCRLPPLRHRLAALSVLRRLNLPVQVLEQIISMAARPVIRYRMASPDLL